MFKLAMVLFIIVAPTLAGSAMVAALAIIGITGTDTVVLLSAIAIGVLLAVPASYFGARAIVRSGEPHAHA
ncbi:MAG: CTP synthetase [Geminicoccaceae bacterium]